jgi:ketosteroid isomerase-like protein
MMSLDEEVTMTVQEIVARYYDAWQHRAGDFSDVPLADDFRFVGPVASFDSADGFRAMARQAGPAVTDFTVRHQFVDGARVCSIVDWEMDLPVAPMTAAEILEVADGRIVRGELIYDAEELRGAMAQAG